MVKISLRKTLATGRVCYSCHYCIVGQAVEERWAGGPGKRIRLFHPNCWAAMPERCNLEREWARGAAVAA